jgi:RING finger protein 170
MPTVLLEIDEDSHPFTYAFLLWIGVVGGLWYFSRQIQARDRLQRVDPAAQGRVYEVREQIQRQRSGSDVHRAEGAPAAAPRRPVAVGEPRERSDCPVCISTVSWPVDTNCAHTFCAGCFLEYYQRSSGVLPTAVTCPICRRKVDVILPTEPGWTAAEVESEAGRKLKGEVDAYNARFSNGPRSWQDAAQDAPHYLSRFWTELTSGGENSMRLMRQMRLWGIIVVTFLYLLAPLDLIPEAVFGLFGMLDDFFIILVGLFMVAGVFRNLQIQQQGQAA